MVLVPVIFLCSGCFWEVGLIRVIALGWRERCQCSVKAEFIKCEEDKSLEAKGLLLCLSAKLWGKKKVLKNLLNSAVQNQCWSLGESELIP